jgi:hypothetical protein
MNATGAEVARIVRSCLNHGGSVEIEGLGTFRRRARGDFVFDAQTRPKVFLAYVIEDYRAAGRLYRALAAAGFDPWLDRKRLQPGQNWPRAIERAISVSDFFVACLSECSLGKRGRFQAELRYALDCASLLPLEQVFFIPARLEECRVPARIHQEFQYVDLFPEWQRGLERVIAVMRSQMRAGRLAARAG